MLAGWLNWSMSSDQVTNACCISLNNRHVDTYAGGQVSAEHARQNAQHLHTHTGGPLHYFSCWRGWALQGILFLEFFELFFFCSVLYTSNHAESCGIALMLVVSLFLCQKHENNPNRQLLWHGICMFMVCMCGCVCVDVYLWVCLCMCFLLLNECLDLVP